MFYKKTLIIFRSSHSQKLFKIGVLKSFAIFTGKHLCWSLFLIKFNKPFFNKPWLERDSNMGNFLWILRNFKEPSILKNISERLLLRNFLSHPLSFVKFIENYYFMFSFSAIRFVQPPAPGPCSTDFHSISVKLKQVVWFISSSLLWIQRL